MEPFWKVSWLGPERHLQLLAECGRIETPAGQHRPHSILSVLRFEGPALIPRWPQDGTKMTQDGPKMAQDVPQMALDGPKMAQDGPKIAFIFRHGQTWPVIMAKDGPTCPEDCPNVAPR